MSATTRTVSELKAFGLQYLRNPFGAAFAIGFPLLLLGVLGAIFAGTEAQRTPIIEFLIQDLDGTTASKQLYATMEQTASAQTGGFNVYPTEPTYDMSVEVLTEYNLTAALVIPAGFQADLEGGSTVDLALYANPSTRSYKVIRAAVEAANNAFAGSKSLSAQAIDIELEEVEVAEGFVFIDFMLPNMIGVAVMLNCLMILSSLMSDYWARGYFKILKTTPLRKWEWILSKLIWYVIVISISVALMLALGIFAFEANAKVTLVSVALVLVGILIFASMGMLLGAWAKNSDTAAGLSQLIGQPMLWLSGAFFPLEQMPEFIQNVSTVLPLTYIGTGLRETMVNGNDAAALGDLGISAGFAVVFFTLATRAIRWKED